MSYPFRLITELREEIFQLRAQLESLTAHRDGRLCTGCSQYLPPERFEKAHHDFPTRDGYNFKCKGCATPYRLERDPETKKVRAKQ